VFLRIDKSFIITYSFSRKLKLMATFSGQEPVGYT
jgi:hypothetical protein